MDNPIVDKVLKLRAKGNDPSVTEAERESFLSAADRLIADHNITQSQLERLCFYELITYTKLYQRYLHAINILERFYNVSVVHQKRSVDTGIILLGFEQDVYMAAYVFNELIDRYRTEFAEYRKVFKAPLGHKNDFVFGMTVGFSAAKDAEVKAANLRKDMTPAAAHNNFPAQSTDLARVETIQPETADSSEQRDSTIKGLTGQRTVSKIRIDYNVDAFKMGYEVGINLKINKAIAGSI